MTLEVIGAGLGRTGTYSLKLALEILGLGPCHHMEEVIRNAPVQVPVWRSAVDGKADWDAAHGGYRSAVDWPTAAFWKELSAIHPDARFILTVRDPEKWHESFSGTILQLLSTIDEAPEAVRPFLEMGKRVTGKSGIAAGMSRDELIGAFRNHCDAVKASIPENCLLVYEVKQGWAPLCEFLGKPVPDEPFPKTNSREEFWEKLTPA